MEVVVVITVAVAASAVSVARSEAAPVSVGHDQVHRFLRRDCVEDERPLKAGSSQLADLFACGGGAIAVLPFGDFAGPRISIPLVAGGALIGLGYVGASWGKIEPRFGTRTKYVKETRMRQFVKKERVPWPNSSSKTARRHRNTRYDVYQIWYKDHETGRTLAWKYGITRIGRRRPESQIGTCNGAEETVWESCDWKWVRQKVRGYFRARAIEATYAARFKAKRDIVRLA
ncbi:MAG: hypothetical protein FWE71_14770 [Nocardioidaceae bacterium]|nr:hypothetical protein [Nocardioidaceae bacterium]MCL2612429.1 hypothetical protein [Nocardioidaceae bacterium]